MTAPLLELDRVDAAYGPFRALFGVSFTVHAGGAVALLGSNGAGKTTVARVVSGLIHPTSGAVRFEGQDISHRKTFELSRLGISHAPEGRSVFASLTVEENLELAFHEAFGRRGVRPAIEEAYRLFPRLGERAGLQAGALSGGEQRMLALARVLVHPPKLLIVDELSLGLAPIVVNEVYEQLARLKERGTSLLVVEQHVEHALKLAERVVVLSGGEVSYQGPVLSIEELAPYFLPPEREAGERESDPGSGRPDDPGVGGPTIP